MAKQVATAHRGNNIENLVGGLDFRTIRVETLTADRTLTEEDSGVLFVSELAAGLDIVLPALANVDIGTFFEFAWKTTVATTASTITAAAGDLLFGGVWVVDFDAAYDSATRDAMWFAPDGSDDLILTLTSGNTTGGRTGSSVRFVAISATAWWVTGVLAGNGTIVTPFS